MFKTTFSDLHYITTDFTEWRKTGLTEENVAQVSSKHDKFQVSFILKVRVPG